MSEKIIEALGLQKSYKELLHLMVKSSVAQNKTNRDTIQLDFLQRAYNIEQTAENTV